MGVVKPISELTPEEREQAGAEHHELAITLVELANAAGLSSNPIVLGAAAMIGVVGTAMRMPDPQCFKSLFEAVGDWLHLTPDGQRLVREGPVKVTGSVEELRAEQRRHGITRSD